MTNNVAVQNYIRFQLSELKAKNEHHRFEDLCRALARLTICERILPATGPVAGSGDQGRDFETFRTYLSSSPQLTSTFLGHGLENDKRMLVFACTMQADGLKNKIKTDIASIMSGPVLPEAVYYYSEANVKVATRHALQEEVLDKHAIHLELFDGLAIAELLCNPDLFWVATEFLSIPTELYPISDGDNEAYLDIKFRWLNRELPPQTAADLSDLRYLTRESTHNSNVKAELTKWVGKLIEFREHSLSAALKRAATYEICVASLRGLNNLTEQLPLLTDYFDAIADIDDPVELVDVSTLLHYCFGAFKQAHLDVDKKLLVQWSERLVFKLDSLIHTAHSDAYLCSLLQSRGTQALLRADNNEAVGDALDELFDYWGKLVDAVINAPMFPLETFSDLLNMLVKTLGTDSRFQKLCEEVDDLLCKRTNGNVAAEKCRDRAMQYIEVEQYALAIRQLHTTKVNWFHAETEYGALLALNVLSECYKRIGMFQASKYYAMAALYLAFHSKQEWLISRVPLMSFHLVETCYSSGEWVSFMEALDIALYAQNAYAPNPQEIQEHSELLRALVHLINLRTLASKFNPNLCEKIDAVISDLQLDSFNHEYLLELMNDPGIPIAQANEDEIWTQLEEEFVVEPFSDLGEKRTIEWKALGICWCAYTPNRYNLVCALEAFVATAQIVITELAKVDLALLPTAVEIDLSVDDIDTLEAIDHDGNNVLKCSVIFPRQWIETGDNTEEMYLNCVGIVGSLLAKCSTLDRDLVVEKIKGLFGDGLTHKISVVQPYPVLFNEYFRRATYQKIDRTRFPSLTTNREFPIQEHFDVGWIDTLGELYTRELSEEHIRNRYIKSVIPIRHSLKQWNMDPSFKLLVRQFRGDGLQDWRILLIVVNIAIGYKLNKIISSRSNTKQINSILHALMHTEEREDDTLIPVSVFTDEAVKIHKSMVAMGNAQTWGLKTNRQTPDMEAMEIFLDVRYRNNIDDIDHDDPFKESFVG